MVVSFGRVAQLGGLVTIKEHIKNNLLLVYKLSHLILSTNCVFGDAKTAVFVKTSLHFKKKAPTHSALGTACVILLLLLATRIYVFRMGKKEKLAHGVRTKKGNAQPTTRLLGGGCLAVDLLDLFM